MECKLDHGILRAYLDHELNPAESSKVETHLDECAGCRSVLQALRADTELLSYMFIPVSGVAMLPDEAALAKLRQAVADRTSIELATPRQTIDAVDTAGILASNNRDRHFEATITTAVNTISATKRRPFSMQSLQSFRSLLFGSSMRAALSAAVMAAVLAVALVFTPLGSAAHDMLGVFRVQKFATVSVDPATLPDSETLKKLSNPDAYGKVETDPKPEISKVDDYAQAQAKAGYRPVQPNAASLPSGLMPDPQLLLVSSAGTAKYMPDYDNIRTALDALGGTNVNLPAALRGSTITYQFTPAVVEVYSNQVISDTRLNPGQKVIGVIQIADPVVTTPDGVDLNQLRDEILKLPNLPADLITQMSSIQDLNSTLVIPIPKGKATSTTVALNADVPSATVISTVDNNSSLVIWESKGFIYVVAGNFSSNVVVDVAKNLH